MNIVHNTTLHNESNIPVLFWERENDNFKQTSLITLHLQTVRSFRPYFVCSLKCLTKMIVLFSPPLRLFCASHSFPSLPPEVWPLLPHPISDMNLTNINVVKSPTDDKPIHLHPTAALLKQALSSFSALRQGEWRWGHGYISFMLSTNCRQMLTVKPFC